jgi:phage shock protein A
MKESITVRVGRIISGGANALIDAVEGAAPTVILEEAIREIDGAIDEVQAEVARSVARRHIANTRLMEANNLHEELGKRIAVAIKEDRDDLAEAALGRQMDIEAQIPVLERDIASASEEQKELKGYSVALHAKKREMQEDLKKFVNSRELAKGTADSPTAPGKTDKTERKAAKAVSAFDRILEKQTGLSGMPISGGRRTVAELAELEDMARQNRIKERLAEAKSRAQR